MYQQHMSTQAVADKMDNWIQKYLLNESNKNVSGKQDEKSKRIEDVIDHGFLVRYGENGNKS